MSVFMMSLLVKSKVHGYRALLTFRSLTGMGTMIERPDGLMLR